MISFPAMLRSILTMLAISNAVIAVLSLVLAGWTSPTAWALFLQLYLTMLLNISLGLDVLFPLESIIPMLKHFGVGGPGCIPSSDILE